jgi:hypothetical protein
MVEDRPRLHAVTDFGDAAAPIEARGNALDAVFCDRRALHGLERLPPGTQHLFCIAEALRRIAPQSAIEEGRQPIAQHGVEALGGYCCLVIDDERIRLAIAEDRRHASHHFVQGHRGGIALGIEIPARRRPATGEERIEVRSSAGLDVLGRRPRQREVEKHEPIRPAAPCPRDTKVVRLDVAVRDALLLEMVYRLQQLFAEPAPEVE